MQKLENFLKAGKTTSQIYDRHQCLSTISESELDTNQDASSETSSKKSFKEKSAGLLNSIWTNIVETY